MSDTSALQELNEAMSRRQPMIKHVLVARAMHEVMGLNLEAAEDVERQLVRNGYEQLPRGDWMLS